MEDQLFADIEKLIKNRFIFFKIINDAVQNAKPLMALESVRVGAVTYTVPTPITEHFSTFKGIKWLIE